MAKGLEALMIPWVILLKRHSASSEGFGMPKRDRAYMDQRKDKILDAATACLLRTGVPGLSTSAICAEAGISMGALYTHFRSKADVLRALAERSASQRRDTLEGRDAAGLRAALSELVEDERSEQGIAISRVDLQLLSLRGDEDDFAVVIQALKDNQDFLHAMQSLAARCELREGLQPAVAAAALESFLMGVKVLTLMGEKHAPAYVEALNLILGSILKAPAGID
jgi:AcrR family transcriptional regulator